jgi:hypothetical protein
MSEDAIQKEIEEMIGAIQPKQAPEKEEVVEPIQEVIEPKEPEPKEEVKEPEPEQVVEPEAKPKEVVKADVIEEEVPAAEVVEPVEDPRIAAMQETINQLSQQLVGGSPVALQPAPSMPTPEPQVDIDFGKFQILPDGVDFEDVVNDKSTFERFMRDVLTRYETSRVRRDALATPTIVSNQVRYVLGLHKAVESFYEANKDLVNVKPLVGAFSNKIVAEHPDWNLPKVMEESAALTRKALGTGLKPVPPKKPVPPVKPSFATTTGARKPAPGKPTKLQSEIEELISDF